MKAIGMRVRGQYLFMNRREIRRGLAKGNVCCMNNRVVGQETADLWDRSV